MYISKLVWDDNRLEHIARHGVDVDEVSDVCDNPRHLAHREGQNRFRLYGQTLNGRYLFVVLEQIENTIFKIITARDMTNAEKQNFRRLKK